MKIRLVLFDGYGTLFEGAFDKLLEICDRIVQENGLEMNARSFLDVWDGHFFPMVREGDFVLYGEYYYEIVKLSEPKKLFGQVDHSFEIAARCRRARKGLFDAT